MPVQDYFKHKGYVDVNTVRHEHFLWMGIPLEGKTVFETGAGIGDHTEWLLKQKVAHVYVNEARSESVEYIRKRFADDTRVTVLPGNLEVCLEQPEFALSVDLVYCYGTLYHLANPREVLLQLSMIGEMLALELLAGDGNLNGAYKESADDPSQSFTGNGYRPLQQDVTQWLMAAFEYVYLPSQPVPGGRSVWIAAHAPIMNPRLAEVED